MIGRIRMLGARFFFWIWFISRGYYWWSKFWRFVLERKYRTTRLTEYANLGQLEAALGLMDWKRDKLKGQFDVISRPEKVERIYRDARALNERAAVGDCDEFAIYAAASIQSMMRRRKTTITEVFFMTINWFDLEGKWHGHNICAFFDDRTRKWGHIGNWYAGKAQLDFDDLEAVAQDFVRDGALVAYAVATPELKLGHIRFGKDRSA